MNTKHFLLTFFLIFALHTNSVFAQEEEQSFTIDGLTVVYTNEVAMTDSITAYYYENELTAAIIDENQNGTPEMWLIYGPDTAVEREIRDSDEDGTPDIFLEYNEAEELTKESGEGLAQYEPVLPEVTEETLVTQEEEEAVDYAGDLEDIEKLAGEGGGWWRWPLLLLFIAIGIFWWRRSKKVT